MKLVATTEPRGHLTMAGTEWPIYDAVYRAGPREWVVALAVCNGVPRAGTRTYGTLREALASVGAGSP